MKLMFASDIHGSETCCRRMAEIYREEQADRLILLGDLLYHGARNELPEGYRPKGVAEILNGMKEELLCVRGNCDSEVDQMVLEFPVMADYALLAEGKHTLFLTHGHHWNTETLPPLKAGDILVNGHTHIPAAERREGILYLNPGSVTMPKGGFPRSYMIWDHGMFAIKDMDGKIIIECRPED